MIEVEHELRFGVESYTPLMESGQLLEVLSSLESRPLEPLEARKREELEFHNEHHAQAHDSNEKFYVVANAKGGATHYMHR